MLFICSALGEAPLHVLPYLTLNILYGISIIIPILKTRKQRLLRLNNFYKIIWLEECEYISKEYSESLNILNSILEGRKNVNKIALSG